MKSNYLTEDLKRLAKYLHDNDFGGHTFLITGATGLIGSLCTKMIIEYNNTYSIPIQVIAFARNEEKVYNVFAEVLEGKKHINYVEFVYQDIAEPISSDIECDYIIHTANSTSSQYFMKHPVEVIESIYYGRKNKF